MGKRAGAIQKAVRYARERIVKASEARDRQRMHDVRVLGIPDTRDVVVDDPFERGAKLLATQSIRDDPLGRLHKSGHIDQAQYSAGREMQGYYERAEIGGVKAMDTTKEPVDGGTIPETMTEQVQRAVQQIVRLERVMGPIDGQIIRAVLRDGLFLTQVAAKFGFDRNERAERYYSRRFRDALETLAKELGYA